MARMSGANAAQVIFKEIMPNLLPYLAATFVGTVSGGVLASVGLDLFGLERAGFEHPGRDPLLGKFLRSPASWAVVVVPAPGDHHHVGLRRPLCVSSGLDEFANPRTRRSV